MKRNTFTLIMLLLASAIVANANPVDLKTVREVALKFMNANTKAPLRGPQDLQLVKTYNIERGEAAFHVFNTPNGFVIVSADDCATPILGYSDEGRPFEIDNVPIQLQDYLQGFVEQIQYGIENQVEDVTSSRQWKLVKAMGRLNENRDGEMVVEPLVTANWGQGCYYNAKCPEDENGQCGHVPTGCVATAMGMILHYWGFPTYGNGSHTYTPYGYPAQTANFGATTYDWGNMPNELTDTSSQAEIDAVSTLLWHCGVSVKMAYGVGGSSAYIEDIRNAICGVFNYSCNPNIAYLFNIASYITINQWFGAIKNNLDKGMPILYGGYTSDYLGHTWVCDGYDADSLLHFNWGWGGIGNGCFAIEASNVLGLEFNVDTYAIFDIQPQCEANAVIHITAHVNDSIAGYVVGTGDFGCDEECTLTAVANEGYHFVKWVEGDHVISFDSVISFGTYYNRELSAMFVEDGEGCNLVFDIYSYTGDGMHDYALVVNYGDGTWERLTFGGGSFASFTREFVDSSHVVLDFWDPLHVFNWFPDVSYVVRFENGAVIYQSPIINIVFANAYYEFELHCEDQFTPHAITADVYPDNSGTVIGDGIYYPSDTCTLSAIPNEGYDFACWIENGEIISTDSTLAFMMDIYDRHFTACFGPFNISLFSNLEEGGYVDGGGTFNFDDTCTINAVANEGYVFLYWIENGNVVFCSSEYSFMVKENMDLMAVFAEEDVVCDIILDFNGIRWAEHSMTLDYGNGISETIIPEDVDEPQSFSRYVYDGNHISLSWVHGGVSWGSTFDIIYGNGSAIFHGFWDDDSQYEFDVNCDWAYAYYDITATASLMEGGIISGTGSFHGGTTCTLVASPNDGYHFLYWSEDDGLLVSHDTSYSFEVSGNRHLVAHFVSDDTEFCNMVFELGKPTLSWESGNLLIIDYGDGVYEQMTTIYDEYSLIPSYAVHARSIRNGSLITLGFVEGVYHDLCEFSFYYEDGDSTYRMFGLDNNFHCAFVANCEDAFIEGNYTINVTSHDVDCGTVEGGGTYSFGQECTLTASPKENYIFRYWTKDGVFFSYSPTYSFNALESANYEAFFDYGIIIGNNLGLSMDLPSTTSANYSISQQIYLDSEIDKCGIIDGIAFYSSETMGTRTRNYTIYLVYTNKTIFESIFDWIAFTDEDKVFEGEFTMGIDCWSFIELTKPFTYDGSGNLALIVIDNTNCGGCGGLACSVFDTETCQARIAWSWDTPFAPSSLPIMWGQDLSYKNQICFCGEFTDFPPRLVSLTANPESGGTVSGAGTYEHGTETTVTATPNEGYFFNNWTENGTIVSADANYSFFVTKDRHLVADFVEDGIITFADENVKNICVEHWDADGDGELSYREAATVTSIDNAFSENDEIISFDELQYFINLATIEDYGFFYSTGLVTITIPNSVTSIGYRAFDGCSSLEQIIVDPENMAYDSREDCNAIINTRTNQLIAGCKNTVIPNSVTSIGDFAFSSCYGLTSIVIPNITSIGTCAFIDCMGLTAMTVMADNSPALGADVFNFVNRGIPVYVPCGSLTAYQNAEGWNEFTNFVEMCEVTQTTTLNPGWNWFSSYIAYDESVVESFQSQLDVLGGTALIKSQSAFASNETGQWAGSLMGFDNSQLYMIQIDEGVTLTLNGVAAVPSEHPITLKPGWTWMGFVVGEAMTLEQVFANITPNEGDIIKGQGGFSTYSSENGWTGSLNALEPGKGYIYLNNGSADITLIYP